MTVDRTRRPGELFFAFGLMLFSLFLFWQAYNIAEFSALSSPGALPLAASAMMLLTACMVFVNTLQKTTLRSEHFFVHIFPPIIGIIMAMILIYAVILESLGFILSTFVFLFVGIQYLYQRHVMLTLGLTLLILVLIYIIFRLVFQVILPEGIVPERDIIATIKNLWKE